jgi:uncharacterized membrane protein
MNLVVWAVLLVLQNAAFTWVSRARNSGSIGYHALASVFSNGIFFATNLILIGLVTTRDRAPAELIVLGIIYVVSTVTGSVLMHGVSMRFLERGKRKVGS